MRFNAIGEYLEVETCARIAKPKGPINKLKGKSLGARSRSKEAEEVGSDGK